MRSLPIYFPLAVVLAASTIAGRTSAQDLSPEIYAILEVVKVPSREYSTWLRRNKLGSGNETIRMATEKWVDDGVGTIVETLTVRGRSGQRAKVENIEEFAYRGMINQRPEADESNAGDEPSVENEEETDDAVSEPKTEEAGNNEDETAPRNEETANPSPKATDTTEPPEGKSEEESVPRVGTLIRNTGVTFEVDPVVSADRKMIDLNMAPEMVFTDEPFEFEADTEEESKILSHPRFITSKIVTQVTLNDGQFSLVGTCRPSKLNKMELGSVFLIFVRCDIIKPN